MTEKQKAKKKVKYIIGFECIAQKYNPNTGYIFGKIFNLEMNGLYNEFQGSIDFLAEKCGLSYVTAWRIVKLLIKDNLIIDTTPKSKRYSKTQVRHYIVNQSKLLMLSEEMDDFTDENIASKKLKNEVKKKYLNDNDVFKNTEKVINNGEYINPFEEDDEINFDDIE